MQAFTIIFTHLKKGQYKDALENIRSNYKSLPITGNDVFQLFAAVVAGLQSSNVAADDVLQVVNLLHFEDLKGKLLTGYIQSLFHLVKFFIDSNNLELILKIQHLLLPPFKQNMTTDTQLLYYKYTSNLLLNRINSEVKCKQCSTDLLYDLIFLVTKMGAKLHDDILKRVENYLYALSLWKCNAQKLQDLYLYVLEMLRCDEILYTKSFDTFKFVLRMLAHISSRLIGEGNAALLKIFYCATLDVLQKVSDVPQNVYKFASQAAAVMVTVDNYTKNTSVVFFLEKLHVDLTTILEQDGSSDYLQEICTFIIQILHGALENSSLAPQTTDVVFNYCQLALNLGLATAADTYTCCCSVKINTRIVFKAYLLIGSIIQYAVNNTRNFIISEQINELLYTSYQNALQIVVKMKLAQCNQLDFSWKLIGIDLYNTSLRLYRSKNEACLRYLELFIKTLLHIESINNSLIMPNALLHLLEMYCEMHLTNKRFESALWISALNIFLHRNIEKVYQAFNQWLRGKVDADLKYRNLTIVAALKNNFNQIKRLHPGFEEITQSDVITELLLSEYKVYSNKWYSTKSMVAVLKELHLHADLETMVSVLISIPLKNIINFGKDLSEVFEDCTKKLKKIKKASHEVQVMKVYLNYFCYKFKTADIISKNLTDMNNTMVVEKPEPLPHEEVPSKNDECDVVSAYESLQLHHHTDIFSNLKQAFDDLTGAARRNNVKENRIIAGNNFPDLIFQMAHDFMLHCYDKEALDVLRLGLKIARALNDEKSIMLFISAVIEHLQENSDLFKKLSLEANVLIKTNEFDASTLLPYYLALSFSYLRSNNIQACLDTHVLAVECFHKIENSEKNDELKIKFYYLQANLMTLPCPYAIEQHKELALYEILKAFKLALSYMLSGGNISTHFMVIAFNVFEHILSTNSWMRLPREMRCYGRDAVCLAQKLVIPLRTSRLLLYLAKADWFSCRYDDCESKLDGVSYILALKRMRVQKEVICEVNLDEAMIDLEDGIHDMLLECPSQNSCMSSPALYKHPFRIPSFVSHLKSCDCLQCCNLEYQQLIMQKTHLEALLGESSGNIEACHDYYKGIFEIFNRIDFETKHKIFKSYNWKSFIDTYDNAMLDYIKFLLRNGKSETARDLQTTFLAKIERDPWKNYYLYNEVLNMELNFLGDFVNASEPEVIAPLAQLLPINDSRTPENKVTKVQFSNKISPTIEVYRPKPRKAPFDLSDIPKSPVHFKTPAAKPKVYNSKSTRSNRLKKENTPTKSVRKRLDSESSTQVSTIGKDNTKARMEKLKASVKLTIPQITIQNNENESRPIRSVRKNLMSELEDVEDVEAKSSTNKVKRRNAMRVKPDSTGNEIKSTTGAVRKTRSKVLK